MKIRNCYVSNSSTSSFIVTKDLTSCGISCIKLTEKQKELINGYNDNVNDQKIQLDLSKDYYLTQFISSYDIEKIDDIDKICYQNGQLNSTPYNEDLYNEYSSYGCLNDSVYILKEHDEGKQMCFNQFVKQYKNTDLPKDVIVKYESDGVKLLYVW